MSLTARETETLLADVLEHLYDYSYLGAHPLGRLRIVDTLLVHDQTPLTHVE